MKIIFYGPVGGYKSQIIGGGESGNRKTIAVLEGLNFTVDVIEKPYPIKNRFAILIFPVQLLFSYFKFFLKLLASRNVTFHLSGFYNHLIYIEWLLVTTSKFFGVKSIYEIRAGGAIESYYENTLIYKYFFKKTLKNASFVLCQGSGYLPFIKSIANIDALYYPNFILDISLLPYNADSRVLNKTIEIVYFGRIVKSKNVEFILEICKSLEGIDFRCEIIGSGNQKYINSLIQLSKKFKIEKNIVINPSHNNEELMNKLKEKHFFLFPSKEKREGHSNSLTEAMSIGVVPLVSKAGFNASIVNNDYLVIEEFNPQIYAEKIISIWYSNEWGNYSYNSYLRIKNSYTENSIKSVLKLVHSS